MPQCELSHHHSRMMRCWRCCWQGVYGAIRLPGTSSAARHHARLTILVVSVIVVTVNCQVFAALRMYLSPVVLRRLSDSDKCGSNKSRLWDLSCAFVNGHPKT